MTDGKLAVGKGSFGHRSRERVFLWWWNVAFNALASLPGVGWQPRELSFQDGLWRASFRDGRCLWFVAQRRFRLYGRGFRARLDRVASRYGAGSAFQIAPGATVVEVGANVGEFTLWAAEAGARVFTVEPDRRHLQALSRNVAAYDALGRGPEGSRMETSEPSLTTTTRRPGDDRVTVAPVACSDRDGEATFYAFPEGADSSLIPPTHFGEQYTVPVRRLDSLAAEWGVTSVDLLKCDAEGAEPEVLRGAAGLLPRVRRVTVDVSPERNGTSTAEACEAILKAAGFQTRFLNKGRILLGERS